MIEMNRMRPKALMSVVAMTSLLTGCAVSSPPIASNGEEVPAPAITDTLAPEGLSQNGLSQNGFSENGLSQNGLSQNGLSQNGLGSAPLASASLAASAPFATWFEADTARGNEVMTYVARCAAPTGATISYVASSGTAYAWPGTLGLAPLWQTAPIATREQELVTACLMAHVNGLGHHVEISVRGAAASLVASTTAAEANRFFFREGAFYGNLFVSPVLHVCSGNAWLQEKLYGTTGRVCTLQGNCGFQWDGHCDDVCTHRDLKTIDAGAGAVGYSVYDRCGASENVVTTFLTL